MAVMAFVGRTTSILEQKTVNNYVASKGIIYPIIGKKIYAHRAKFTKSQWDFSIATIDITKNRKDMPNGTSVISSSRRSFVAI